MFPGVRGGPPTRALEPIALAVADNDFITMLGPSGCGKSTLLRIVAGLDRPSTGPRAARRRAGDAPGRRPRHGVPVLHAVPVAHGARQHLLRPAREGRAGGAARARCRGLYRDASASRASSATTRSSSRAACSSGPRSPGRSPTNPTILLLDEPFGALDNQTRALMQELLLGIWERERKTVLFVTHDIEEAIFLATRVVVMTARPGRIKAELAVDLPHPRHYTDEDEPGVLSAQGAADGGDPRGGGPGWRGAVTASSGPSSGARTPSRQARARTTVTLQSAPATISDETLPR